MPRAASRGALVPTRSRHEWPSRYHVRFGSERARLIQDQAPMRNVDSKIKSPQFDRYVYSFHRSFAATFSTASTHSGSRTTSQRYNLAAPARMVAQRADDLGCRLAQVAQVISGKFLGRECRLDPENIHRTVDARAIQQRGGHRCQSIVYRRISIGSAAERGIAGAV